MSIAEIEGRATSYYEQCGIISGYFLQQFHPENSIAFLFSKYKEFRRLSKPTKACIAYGHAYVYQAVSVSVCMYTQPTIKLEG